jgi:hypothetical protein
LKQAYQEIVNFCELPQKTQAKFAGSAKQNRLPDSNQMMITHYC